LSRSPSLSPGLLATDGRAFDYFRVVVAPVLSTRLRNDFWTDLVPRVSSSESAVRDAVVAISALYEDLDDGPKAKSVAAAQAVDAFAVARYNRAVRTILGDMESPGLVVLACVLFICIESMRGNHVAAVEHCRHGIRILNETKDDESMLWAREHLMPLFVRLGTSPFFFGANTKTFPALQMADPSLDYDTLEDAEMTLDWMVTRCLRLIRSVHYVGCNPNPSADEMPEKFWEEKSGVVTDLARWNDAAVALLERLSGAQADRVRGLRLKAITMKIWVNVCPDTSETVFDMYADDFADGALQAREMCRSATTEKPKYIFDIGYLPPLYFIVIKSRILETRLAALEAMPILAITRENLWDATLMYSIGTRLIEKEHGYRLDDPEAKPNLTQVLPSKGRISDSVVLRGVEPRIIQASDGEWVPHRKVVFVRGGEDGLKTNEEEWVPCRPLRSIALPHR
jgi:hypothetical protein